MGNYACDCISSSNSKNNITQNKMRMNESRVTIENSHLSDSEKKTIVNIDIDEYQPKKFLESDYYGTVVLAKRKNSKDHLLTALKIIEKSKLKQSIFLNRLKNDPMKRYDFLVEIFNIYENDTKVFIAMEYIEPGNLLFYLKKEGQFHEEVIKEIASEILQAIKILHNEQLIYGNLKTESVIVMHDGHVKLTDYWYAVQAQNVQNAQEYSGVIEYTPPEILNSLGWYLNNLGYDQSIDIWAFGVFLYQLKFGVTPFGHFDKQSLIRGTIIQGLFIMNQQCSGQFQHLIKQLLSRNPKQRPTIQYIENHPFFANVDWENIQQRQNIAPLKEIVKKFNTRSHHMNYQKLKRIQLTQASIYPIIQEHTVE